LYLKGSVTWTIPPALFALVILGTGSHFFTQAILDLDPPILSFPTSLGWQVSATVPSFFSIENGVLQTFDLEPPFSQSQPPKYLEWQVQATTPS
jgi:hypothetical protein